ncbi:MAG: TldD/PmbA family protein [Candidatus Cloacimonadota bacterium]|nr:MAG: TldD/PmbA family protein [Candidatus Cloacimonadota bacterium]
MIEILEKAKKIVDNTEIFWVKGKEYPVIFRANKFYTVERKDFEGLGIRVINRGKLGFANTTKIETCGAILDFAKNASKFGETARFIFPEKTKVKPVQTFFNSVKETTTEEIKERNSSVIKDILKKEPGVKVDLEYRKLERTVRIINTRGLDVTFKKTYVSIYALIFLVIDNSFIWIYKFKTSPKKLFINKDDIKELLKKTELAKNPVPIESGKKSVIFMPSVMPILLRSLTMGVNGKLVQKGTSPLKDRKNRKLLDRCVTIYDDPLLKNGIATRPFDGEGIASKRIPIFNKGILRNFLFDLQTAGILGEKSTGSAVRGYDEQPSPGISNFVVSPGEWSVADMVRDIKNGIIVHSVIGGGQSNILAGDFSCNVSLGFRIKNGRMIGRVKNTMIAGNVYDVMNNIEGVGKRVENMRSFYTPAFYFKSLNVVG